MLYQWVRNIDFHTVARPGMILALRVINRNIEIVDPLQRPRNRLPRSQRDRDLDRPRRTPARRRRPQEHRLQLHRIELRCNVRQIARMTAPAMSAEVRLAHPRVADDDVLYLI